MDSLDVLLSSSRERRVISIIEEYLCAPISNTRVHQPAIRTDLDLRSLDSRRKDLFTGPKDLDKVFSLGPRSRHRSVN